MAKNLASKLRTGAMVGLAALAVAAPMKAKGNLIYDSGYITNTLNTAEGKYLQTVTRQTIDDSGDFYNSAISVQNTSQGGPLENQTYFLMNMNEDLAGLGATGLTNYWAGAGSVWNYQTTGENTSSMIVGDGAWPMMPSDNDFFYYTIKKDLNADGIDDVVGWENVGASMVANAGNVNFAFQAPQAIPEPTTMAILASGAVALLAGRRIRNSYKQAA